MDIFFKLLATYTVLSMAAGGMFMFLDTVNGFRWNCDRAVAILWLGPIAVWCFLFTLIVLVKLWA